MDFDFTPGFDFKSKDYYSFCSQFLLEDAVGVRPGVRGDPIHGHKLVTVVRG